VIRARLAVLPLAIVPFVLRAVSESYDATYARDLDDAGALVRGELDRLGADVTQKTRAVAAAGTLMTEIARLLEDDNQAALVALAEPALAESGLDVLSVIDRSGRTLLSGHLPARLRSASPPRPCSPRWSCGRATRSGRRRRCSWPCPPGSRTGRW
jgi:hypothetical protein